MPPQYLDKWGAKEKVKMLTEEGVNDGLRQLDQYLRARGGGKLGAFRMFDINRDRIISREEFNKKVAQIGICTEDQGNQLFDVLKPKYADYLNFTSLFSAHQNAGHFELFATKPPTGIAAPGSRDSIQQYRSNLKDIQDMVLSQRTSQTQEPVARRSMSTSALQKASAHKILRLYSEYRQSKPAY